ncbi:hypothetical protein MYX76_11010 [Desulfobacterota bacterium AH_259_B03_O07]|nr:hypothetical protein [Desulfobacterota bacterium AH_259_B03_O07]
MVEKRLDESIHIKYKDQYLNYKEIHSDQTYDDKATSNTLAFNDLITGDIFTLHQG